MGIAPAPSRPAVDDLQSGFRCLILRLQWPKDEQMRWIRLHIRPATWLALAALAVHVVVTFGHVHAEWFSTPSAGATPIAAAALDAPDKAKGAGKPTQPYRAPGADNF
jgi:hypothetical protein